MNGKGWMIYGAYGYTGELVAEEALRQGHRPLLAGRDPVRLRALADRLGLDWVSVDLGAPQALRHAVARVSLVFHAAGPFVHTSAPMVEACLATGAHYLDITGEIPVFEATLARDGEAKARGVVLMPGAGFDVVPSDCLARHVADQVPGARRLDIALSLPTQPSAGTSKSMLEMLPSGSFIRRDGQLVPAPLGEGRRRIRFRHREQDALPLPWGDLATAYRTTGIENITTYLALPDSQRWLLERGGEALRRALRHPGLRTALLRAADRWAQGPDAHARQQTRSHLWARAEADDGRFAEAWLETPESYALTASVGVRAVERVLAGGLSGALTPARAFGSDFILEAPGVERQS